MLAKSKEKTFVLEKKVNVRDERLRIQEISFKHAKPSFFSVE